MRINLPLFVLGLCLLCSCSPRHFLVFDTMHYRGKPDLSGEGLSRIDLIYENKLVTDGRLDWDKVSRQVRRTAEGGYKYVSIDIESWYDWRLKVPAEQVKLRLDSLFRAFKAEIPDCRIGNYGVPVQNLNVLRFVCYASGRKPEEVQDRWMASSRVREPAGEVCDILLPSLYIYGFDIGQWTEDLRTTMDYIRKRYPGKPVYVYVWPQCYDHKTNPDYMKFLSGDQMERMLEACWKCTDGVILWASGVENHRDRPPVYWHDPRVQDCWAGIRRFLRRHHIRAVD